MKGEAGDLARPSDSLGCRKGENVIVLAVQGLTLIADYFVIASAGNRGTCGSVIRCWRVWASGPGTEGYEGGLWVLLDYGDVVVHVFRETERTFYGLERLWGDAPKVTVSAKAMSGTRPHAGI